jgi:hypothetical protein
MSSFTNDDDDEFTNFASSDVPNVSTKANDEQIPNNQNELFHADQRVDIDVVMSAVENDGVLPVTNNDEISQSLPNGFDNFEEFESMPATCDEPPTQPVIESDNQLHNGIISGTVKAEVASPTDDSGLFASSDNVPLPTTIGQNTTQESDIFDVFGATNEDTVKSSGNEQTQQSLLDDGLFDQSVDVNPMKEDVDEFGEFAQVNELSDKPAGASLVEDDHSALGIEHANDEPGDFNTLATCEAVEAVESKVESDDPVLVDQDNFDKSDLVAAETRITRESIAQEDDVHDFGDIDCVIGGPAKETDGESAEPALINDHDVVDESKKTLNSAQRGDSELNNGDEESGVIEEKTDSDFVPDTDDTIHLLPEKQHSKEEESNNKATDSDATRDGVTEDSAIESDDLDQVNGYASAQLVPTQNPQQEDDDSHIFGNFDGASVHVLPDAGANLTASVLAVNSSYDFGGFGSSENAAGLVTEHTQGVNGDAFGDFDEATGDAPKESAGEPAKVALASDFEVSQQDNNDEFGEFDETIRKVAETPGGEQTDPAFVEDDEGLLLTSTQDAYGDDYFDVAVGEMPRETNGESAEPALLDDADVLKNVSQDDNDDEFGDFDGVLGAMLHQSSTEPAGHVDGAEIFSMTNQNVTLANNIGDEIADSDWAHRETEKTAQDAQESPVDDDEDFGDFGGFENAELATVSQSQMNDDERNNDDLDEARGDTAEILAGQAPADDDDDDNFGEFGSFENAELTTENSKPKQETDDEFDEFGDFGEANASAEVDKVGGTQAEATNMASQTNQEALGVGAFAERAESTFQTLFGRFSREHELPPEISEEPSTDIVPISSLLVSFEIVTKQLIAAHNSSFF